MGIYLLEGFEVGIVAVDGDLELARMPGQLAGHEDVAVQDGADAEALRRRPRLAVGNAGIAHHGLVADQAEHREGNVGKLEVEAVCLELAAGQPFDPQISLEFLCSEFNYVKSVIQHVEITSFLQKTLNIKFDSTR